MALRMVASNGWNWIRGADAADTALPLGPVATSWKIGKRHYLGINSSYQNPLFIRAYFDPAGLNLTGAAYVGYMQTLEPKIGIPVPPSVFGGEIGKRPVVTGTTVVDFMGPADVAARLGPFGPAIPPFYPINAMLRTPVNALTAFGRTNAPLGFLYFPTSPQGLTGPDVARAASLTAQLNMSLLTQEMLFAASPGDTVTGGPIRFAWGPYSFPMTRQAFAQKPLAQHAIDLLRQSTTLGLTATDKTLQATDFRFSRFVGRNLLINIIDNETMDPVLCVWHEDTTDATRPVTVKVAVINYDALDDKEEQATYQLLARAADYIRIMGLTFPVPARSTAKGKGTPMPLAIADGQTVATVSVTNVVYGVPARITRRTSRPIPISGITYDVEFTFDGLGRKLTLKRVANIRELTSMAGPEAAMAAYFQSLAAGQGTVDVSNFELVGLPLTEPIPAPPA